jgi:hypothetical protein
MGRIKRRVSRRDFMRTLLCSTAVLGPLSPLSPFARAQSLEQEEDIQGLLTEPESDFIFGRVFYRGGDWNTDMLYQGLKGGSEINLLKRVVRETGIEAIPEEHVVKLTNPLLFTVPFLYMTGHGTIIMGASEIDNLRVAIENGAFLLGDACNGKGSGFDINFRKIIRRVFPQRRLQQIPVSHPVFHCFYEIKEILGGDKRIDPYLEGIILEDGRLGVVYTVNDLGCAWEGHGCAPGGEDQRDHAFRMGINLVVYAMTH